MSTVAKRKLTIEEYLAHEERSEVKHEYHDGELVAMVGVTRAHARLAMRFGARLDHELASSPCEVYLSDFKVLIDVARRFFYPDVVVSCEEGAGEDHYTTQPRLIVEVLSESTAAFDRGPKFACYRMLDSLQEYVLVDTEQRAVDCYRRGDGDTWIILPTAGPGSVLQLTSVGLSLPIDELYEGSGVA